MVCMSMCEGGVCGVHEYVCVRVGCVRVGGSSVHCVCVCVVWMCVCGERRGCSRSAGRSLFFDCISFVQQLMSRVSHFMHLYTLYSAVRPFGCSLMMGSYGPEGPSLYMADPSGVSWVSRVGNLCSTAFTTCL